ncbi:hypothetical protein AAFF_G00387440 [Aldrovandia affinis]|uniref:Uncharacterized protein n=1 Tax=Aldrovandia affinis TaxID=143900 RepID=A0AAD7SEL1_9TELE|nr:hypothetical protein AAFF_G00387440 [Aldrovandia affinis]
MRFINKNGDIQGAGGNQAASAWNILPPLWLGRALGVNGAEISAAAGCLRDSGAKPNSREEHSETARALEG